MEKSRIKWSLALLFSAAIWAEQASLAGAFVQTGFAPGSKVNDFTSGRISKLSEPSGFAPCRSNSQSRNNKSTELYSFMGSDGGLFGIGTPELVSQTSNKKSI